MDKKSNVGEVRINLDSELHRGTGSRDSARLGVRRAESRLWAHSWPTWKGSLDVMSLVLPTGHSFYPWLLVI